MTGDRHPLRRYLRHGLFPQLLAFESCARLGSVTQAAEELCLAQPTVSCLVRKLSEVMGGPVLENRGRRMQATALGLTVLALCDELIPAFERFDQNLQALGQEGDKHARVMMAPDRHDLRAP